MARADVAWLAGVALAAALSALLTLLIARRANRSLRARERHYRGLVAESFGLICTHDLDGVLLMVNPAAAQALGYSPRELEGRNLRELLAPAGRGSFGSYLNRLQTGQPGEGLMRILARDGAERIWMYRNHLVTAEAAAPYVLGHALDVTERLREEKVRKRHAAELARTNAALQAEIDDRALAEQERDRFFDISVEMLCIIGYDGYFKHLNPAWERLLGYSLEEMLSRPIVELVHPDDRVLTETERQRLRLGVGVVEFENRYLTRDGSYRWLAWRATAAPERRLIYAVARDVQQQKQVEQMKNDFISVVSHELRTPLTSIRGALGLLAGGVFGELPEKARVLLEIAAKNSERLGRLINDILDIEKIESGKMEFRFVPLELMPLLEQAVESNRGYATTYEVELRIVAALEGLRVWADADRLQQVVTNLLSNACKFSPRGGVVEIAVTRSHANRVRIAVTDHGKGIPPEFKESIFEKFVQADISSTREKGGTGLGLSISKAIVERLGGRIGFESELGVATTFAFELPEWGGAAAEPPPSGGPRILICEDDVDVANLLTLMLEREGFGADVAINAATARQWIRERRYAAMTVDLTLPDQDGISLIRELRAEAATSRLPIVVVSVRAREGRTELNGGALGVVDWLAKPIDEAHLLSAVRRAVRGATAGKIRILHVEDDPDLQRVVAAIIAGEAEVEAASTLAEARLCLSREHFDLVILDLALPDGSGLDLLTLLGNLAPPTPVLIFSAHEVDREVAGHAASVLVKSQTSNRELLETIRSVLAARTPTPWPPRRVD
ncbi:MAG: PAS domain S-box protein [Thermoanaerobaculia bacterium]